MKRKFATFDIDGTLVRWQLFHATTQTLAQKRSNPPKEWLKAKELYIQWKQRGSKDIFTEYEAEIVNTWFEIMKTATHEEFLSAIDTTYQQHKDQVYRYTRDLIINLKKQGYYIIAISGSYQEIVDKIAKYYQFDYARGSFYDTNSDGRFTGTEYTPIFDKGAALRKIVKEQDLSWSDSYAIGDTFSDSKMMQLVANPIAFNPDQRLLAIAKQNQWNIVVERKNVIYELSPQNNIYQLNTDF